MQERIYHDSFIPQRTNVRPAAVYLFTVFLINASLKPIRDQLVVEYVSGSLEWLFTVSFVSTLLLSPVMGLFIKGNNISSLIKWTHLVYAFVLLVLFIGFKNGSEMTFLVMLFFIINNFFNLVLVALFWVMVGDTFTSNIDLKKTTLVSTGATLGALMGPMIVIVITYLIAWEYIYFSMVVLTALCPLIIKFAGTNIPNVSKLMGQVNGQDVTQTGRFAFSLLLYASLSSFFYILVVHKSKSFELSTSELVTVFAARDLAINVLTLLLQYSFIKFWTKSLSVEKNLKLVPTLSGLLFTSLLIAAPFFILIGTQVLFRSINLSIMKPTREIVFSQLSINNKKSIKLILDTTVYKLGDMLGAWVFILLGTFHSDKAIFLGAITMCLVWLVLNIKMGNHLVRKKLVKHKTL